MNATDMKVKNGRKKAQLDDRRSHTSYKHKKREARHLRDVKARIGGGNSTWKKVKYARKGPLPVVRREQGKQSAWRTRKGKVHGIRVKESSTTMVRITRSRSVTVSRKDGALSELECRMADQATTTTAALGGRQRKRGREMQPRKTSSKTRERFSPQLTNIREEKSGPDGEVLTGEASSRAIEVTTPQIELESVELFHSRIADEVSKMHLGRKFAAKKKGTAAKVYNPNALVNLHREGKEKKGVRKLKAKNLSPTILTVTPGKKNPVMRGATGLQSLRYSTHKTVRASYHSESQPSCNAQTVETTKTALKASPEAGQEAKTISPENGNDDGPKVDRNKYSTTSALKVADDASGFVRTALKAVEDARNIDRKIKEQSTHSAVENDTKNLGSLRSKTTMSAEELIAELAAIRLTAKGNAKQISKESRKGKKSKQRQAGTTATASKEEAINGDGVQLDGRVPKAVKLGWKARKNIEKRINKSGLLGKPPRNRGSAGPGRGRQPESLAVPGFERLICGAGGDKEFQGAVTLAVSSVADEGWQLRTKEHERETALQGSYYSTTKSSVDFWLLDSKLVPGRNAEECFDTYYSRDHNAAPPVHQNGAVESAVLHSKSPKAKAVWGKQILQMEAHRTIHDILKMQHVEDPAPAYEGDAFAAAVELPDVVESVLDRAEDDTAVILSAAEIRSSPASAHIDTADQSYFESIVIGGLDTPPDKENRKPHGTVKTCRSSGEQQACTAEVLKVKNSAQLEVNHLHLKRHSRRPSSTCTHWQNSPSTTNNVYLHSKDALDFGETTLDAIQRAKQELRNVFLRAGSNSGTFFDADACNNNNNNNNRHQPEDEEEYDVCT